MLQVAGATAIITGAASGLGAATSRRLYNLGANVVLVDFNREMGEAAANNLGERAAFVAADVTNPEQTASAVERSVEVFGRLDVLINCAGIGPNQRTITKTGPHDLQLFRRTIEVNLIGVFDMIRLAAWKMAGNLPNDDGERGVIVNTASTAGYEGQVGQAAYSASKAAIIGMTLTIARDLGSLGIRVCTIAPGVFDTPLLSGIGEGIGNGLAAAAPFPRRTGRPDEFAQIVQQVMENVMLNGETIRLDGALRMPPK